MCCVCVYQTIHFLLVQVDVQTDEDLDDWGKGGHNSHQHSGPPCLSNNPWGELYEDGDELTEIRHADTIIATGRLVSTPALDINRNQYLVALEAKNQMSTVKSVAEKRKFATRIERSHDAVCMRIIDALFDGKLMALSTVLIIFGFVGPVVRARMFRDIGQALEFWDL